MSSVSINMPKAILTDIEGTTTSVSFVYETLFPFFAARIPSLINMLDDANVRQCFDRIKDIIREEDGLKIDDEDVLKVLENWVKADRKETNLKTLQGIVWNEGYLSGDLKGHIYPDVPEKLKEWHDLGINLAVYSSGSVSAQKLLFGHSEYGDMCPLFSSYFDTKIGHKRDAASYKEIASQLELEPNEILFLSDIEAELEAASESNFQCIQLVRPGTETKKMFPIVDSFEHIIF